ncbi:NucA/NucB deoxyribonuclease domain-containing protein [Streptomyces sp. NPDC001296]
MLRTANHGTNRERPRRTGRWGAALVAALAALLFLATGTAQAAGPSPSPSEHHKKTSKVYLKVTPETAKSVRGGDKPIKPPSLSGAHKDGARTTPVSSITPNECLAQSSSRSGNGYGKDRFASCQAYHLHAWHVVCDWLFGCDQVGTADADLVDIQYTGNGARDAYIVQFLGNWVQDGDMSEITLTVDTTCTASAGSGPCNAVSGSPTTEPVEQWVLGDEFLYYSFEQPVGAGADQVSNAHLNWHITVAGGENGPVTRDGPDSGLRCDSASYIIQAGGSIGCVFPWVAPQTLVIHRGTTPESAQNIWEAQNTPLSTQPPSALLGMPFKSIPGSPASGRPLHRDRDNITAHRNTARAACRTYFPGKYPAPNTDCDEYPFASTQEGAVDIGGFRNYVVKPIDSDDNQQAGRELGDFYADQRILGSNDIHDPFYVSVQP